ncbi:aspartate aminotransferase, cytoplasmic-like [Lethenteron reissneri]|uniref:aspartate aminotransferase, cytoplasmic-like n=1 Tax=Lethenteron reissneri TaxID=7753 RepID=UPI002AB7A2D3|nr:aspartate aminotransferase, cytoplasmic-like [Lethenteron reissneri]
MAHLPVKLTKQDICTETEDHEYLPMRGLETFLYYSVKWVLGEKYSEMVTEKVSAIQCPNETGGINLALNVLKKVLGLTSVFVPSSHQGALEVANAVYYGDIITYTEINEIKAYFLKAQLKQSAVLILDCRNENEAFWKQACKLVKDYRVFPLLLMAWVPVRDNVAPPLHAFLDGGLEVIVLQSFQHLLRPNEDGAALLLGITADAHGRTMLQSQFESITRCLWGPPPNHGARIVAKLLQHLDSHNGPSVGPVELYQSSSVNGNKIRREEARAISTLNK